MPFRPSLASLAKYAPFRYLPGIAAAVAVVVLISLGLVEEREYWSLERFFELRGARAPVAPIVIVSIDEPSFRELDRTWPFPRNWHAEAIRRIAAGKPLVIGVDVLFPEPDPDETRDKALGDAVAAAGNVVLGSAPKEEFRPDVGQHWDPNRPGPPIRRNARVGPVNMVQDDVDSHIRRAPLLVPVPTAFASDGYVQAFDVEIYDAARKAGLRAAELPPVPQMLINFNGP